MAVNEYTPQQAFEVLMNHLRTRDEQLAVHIQSVVDAGKDVDETQQLGQRRNRSRSYRRTVPYNYQEALQVALDALRAYFVEQPLFVDSCAKNMAETQLGSERPSRPRWETVPENNVEIEIESRGKRKRIEIELRTETQISEGVKEMLELQEIDAPQIEQQQNNIRHLSALLHFEV